MIVFVVGTGTDVGKTHVTASLMKVASNAGAWKPVATGMPETDEMGDDARAIGATEPPLYAFEPPISPHLAARRAKVTIRAKSIAEHARAVAIGYEVLFVESAGGLFSPISETETNLDVARAIEKTKPKTSERMKVADRPSERMRAERPSALMRAVKKDFRILLVAPDRIGVLHDITATIRAADIKPVIALSAPAVADASTGTNAGEIRRLGLTKHVVEFPRATIAKSQEAARRCMVLLQDPRS